MNIVFCSLTIFIMSGLLALSLNRFVKLANYIGAIGAVCACVLGLSSLFIVYNSPGCAELSIPWFVPDGSLSVAIDSLGALFLFPIFILSALAALYGAEYLRHYYGKKNIGSAWFFFNLLIASMVLVVISRNAILFLLAWEMMSMSSFFLVLFEGEKKEAAQAGLIYLIAAQIGTLFLLAMFILLSKDSGSFDFPGSQITAPGFLHSIIFLCALIGFGTKAGFMPMHIWLPEAHPAAPSHVSAVMSGVMIKTGIYGLLRVINFLGTPCVWWGWLLIFIGIVSGIFGILFALAQQDLKRLLAYSSIENIGIISMGIGLGVLGMSMNNPTLIVLGFAGGLLHVINHAFFKGLLFLGAGVILHETGTRKIDLLGGLLKKMPVTGFCFLVGAAAICGLPVLNGFISEFLIYFASLKGIFGSGITVFVCLGIIASLALIGCLATVLILLIAALRQMLLKGRRVERVLTWDCGYAKPEARMQYTASSYVQPIADFFRGILRTQKHGPKISEYFPDVSFFKTETADLFSETVFRPALKFIHRLAERLTGVQHGQLHLYILYILFTLIALFIWKL
ncbi:MAG: hypothetical protein HY810_00800 [Candidatus Omnitrophica bacterium]|nr:hypothetical protein [Candidatus Omnitrophota bacterium]